MLRKSAIDLKYSGGLSRKVPRLCFLYRKSIALNFCVFNTLKVKKIGIKIILFGRSKTDLRRCPLILIQYLLL